MDHFAQCVKGGVLILPDPPPGQPNFPPHLVDRLSRFARAFLKLLGEGKSEIRPVLFLPALKNAVGGVSCACRKPITSGILRQIMVASQCATSLRVKRLPDFITGGSERSSFTTS